MFHQLVNHNDDIRRLVKIGYAVAFDNNHLVIRDIPYLNQNRELAWGAIVTPLIFTNEVKVIQNDHQIFFAGSAPHNTDGTPITSLSGGLIQVPLTETCSDVVVQRSFSNKIKLNGQMRDYVDFFEKIETYVSIISGPAMKLHNANPYTYRAVGEVATDPIFKFQDTLTSRARISDLTAKLEEDVIAIIGLGGTGSYILDFIVKTRVKEIRAFDQDSFYVHNAYRSPGGVDASEFGKTKADVYKARYESFRHGLSIIPKFIDETSEDELNGVTFAFVSVDKGSSRTKIFDLLIAKGIPFIDVGMGLSRKRGSLSGMLHTTYYSVEDAAKLREQGKAELADAPDDVYRDNIQISELNALNASYAVHKYKQIRGFYLDESQNYELAFDISDSKRVGESNESESKSDENEAATSLLHA